MCTLFVVGACCIIGFLCEFSNGIEQLLSGFTAGDVKRGNFVRVLKAIRKLMDGQLGPKMLFLLGEKGKKWTLWRR